MVNQTYAFDYTIEYKAGSDNKAADALSRVTGVELLASAISTTGSELLQVVENSWTVDIELKELIEKLQTDSNILSQFSWCHNKFSRKGKLVVGKVAHLR